MASFEAMPGIFLDARRAAWLPKIGALAVADIHLGYESMIEQEGVAFPRRQTAEALEALEQLINEYSPSHLVFCGDLKQEFSKNTPQEWRDIKQLLEALEKFPGKAHFIRGNHDNYLATILAKYGRPLVDEVVLGGIAFAHGHTRISKDFEAAIIGHEHPAVVLSDEVGARIRLPCFIKSGIVIVLPAFSSLVAGRNILKAPPEGFLSEALEGAKAEEASVYPISAGEIASIGTIADVLSSQIE